MTDPARVLLYDIETTDLDASVEHCWCRPWLNGLVHFGCHCGELQA